jgi:AraC-like DNA-binding protein
LKICDTDRHIGSARDRHAAQRHPRHRRPGDDDAPRRLRAVPGVNHPAGNISIGTLDDRGVPLDPPEGRVYGVQQGLSRRRLSNAGWTVAARTAVGGLGVFLDGPAKPANDAELPLSAIPGLDAGDVIASVSTHDHNATRTERLRDALAAVVERRSPDLVHEAREVVRVARLAERDRSVRRVEQLAEAAGVSVRTLQRLFDLHVGASPSFVIRRWRIIDAVEEAKLAVERREAWRGWAAVAADLGYADQAHLTRDFRDHLGMPPSDYLAMITHP